uniref:Muscleblind-like protein n=1 Tax=Globodera rostochiensis TaxID=31243 RepID=A0A914H1U6_GLORO
MKGRVTARQQRKFLRIRALGLEWSRMNFIPFIYYYRHNFCCADRLPCEALTPPFCFCVRTQVKVRRFCFVAALPLSPPTKRSIRFQNCGLLLLLPSTRLCFSSSLNKRCSATIGRCCFSLPDGVAVPLPLCSSAVLFPIALPSFHLSLSCSTSAASELLELRLLLLPITKIGCSAAGPSAASSTGGTASAASVLPPTSAAAALTLVALNAGAAAAASTSSGCAIPTSLGGTAPLALQQQQQQLTQLLTGKDSRWLQLEVCREFQRGQCSRSEQDCKYAHPPPYVEVQNGRVTACYDSIKGRCSRENPKCKYLHPPQHLKDQLLATGKQNLVMKNLVVQQLSHQQQSAAPTMPTFAQLVQPGVAPLAALQSAATALPLPFFTTAATLPAGLFPAGTAAFLPQVEQHFGSIQTTSPPSASVSVPSAAATASAAAAVQQQQLAVAQQLALLQQQHHHQQTAPNAVAAALFGSGGGGSSTAAAAAALMFAQQQQQAAAVQAAQQNQQQQQQQQQQLLFYLALQQQQQHAVAAAMLAAQHQTATAQQQSSSPTSDGGGQKQEQHQMQQMVSSSGGGRKRNARTAGLEHKPQLQHQPQQQQLQDGTVDAAVLDPVQHQLQLQLAAAAANANGTAGFLSAVGKRPALDKSASVTASNGGFASVVSSSALASAGGMPFYAATPAQFNPYLVPAASFLPAGAVSFATQLPPRFG